jgi:hypothetical protein
MPQIKFSALVTDMKGKANGSVFSSNKQGSYFRNNKWGGGRKTARWQNAKVNLAFLSNAWKNLTNEEREAWNAAAPDNPFLNKFKVEYIPSGYQLFMSWNGNLLGANFPILNTPGSKRPFPEDLTISMDMPIRPWVTSGTGLTFPTKALSSGGCVDSLTDCPLCFKCNPLTHECYYDSSNPWGLWTCAKLILDSNINISDNQCSTDQDCYDAGLGTGTDIECQNGQCVYVGDGLPNTAQTSYVLNVTEALFNGGQWSNEDSFQDTFLRGSFRILLQTAEINSLMTTDEEIVIVSNYDGSGMGTTIRIRPQDREFCYVSICIGINSTDTVSQVATFVWTCDLPISLLAAGTVMQYEINPGKTQQHHIIFGNGDSRPISFEWYSKAFTKPMSTWGTPEGTGNNPLTQWNTHTNFGGFVFGAGLMGRMVDIVLSDIRFYSDSYESFLEPAIGQLTGVESVLILANGEAKPKCSGVECEGIDPGTQCIGVGMGKSCYCLGGRCVYAKLQANVFRNAAQFGDSRIKMYMAMPIYNVEVVDDNYQLDRYAGTWLNFEGGFFASNNATFVPNYEFSLTAPTESGFAVIFSCSRPKPIGSTFYPQELITIWVTDTNINKTESIWSAIKSAIASVPPGMEIAFGWDVIDTNTGMVQGPKKKIRFKAGADLSSSVN